MLLLTRSKGQAIIIGDNIKIVVLEIKGHQVRLGVQAPKNVPVHREEIFEKIKAERK